MRYHVVNLGCKVNRVESDAVATTLAARGWTESAICNADLIVINTCAVTGEAEKKTRKSVHHALSANDDAPVLVTGCAAALTPEFYCALDDRVRVVFKANLLNEIETLAKELDRQSISFQGVLPVGSSFHTRVGVKIQDGCDHACTYCIVHVARGKSTSKDAQDVINECKRLAFAGVKEIVLTGINIGAYRGSLNGRDIALPGLLRALIEETKVCSQDNEPLTRFRIGSIEPCDVDDDLIMLLAESDGRIARHLHLPLQSGSTRVLREMARPYTAQTFCSLVDKLHDAVSGIALSTDIIVGFPGETEEDFLETVRVAEHARFMKIHVFPYSRRENTPAALRKDQVDPTIKARRAAELRSISERLAAQDRESRKGITELALVEQAGRATLESYHEVIVDPNLEVGSLVPVVL